MMYAHLYDPVWERVIFTPIHSPLPKVRQVQTFDIGLHTTSLRCKIKGFHHLIYTVDQGACGHLHKNVICMTFDTKGGRSALKLKT